MSTLPAHPKKDYIGQTIHIGDIIVNTGASASLSVGIVDRFTPQGAGIANGDCKPTSQCIVVTDHYKAIGKYDELYDKYRDKIESYKTKKVSDVYRYTLRCIKVRGADEYVIYVDAYKNGVMEPRKDKIEEDYSRYFCRYSDGVFFEFYSPTLARAMLPKKVISNILGGVPLRGEVVARFTRKRDLQQWCDRNPFISGDLTKW